MLHFFQAKYYSILIKLYLFKYFFVFLGSFKGGWASQYTDTKQFFQIDLGLVAKVTRIATQGQFETGWWTKTYTIDYSVDGGTFLAYGKVDVYANNDSFQNGNISFVLTVNVIKPIKTKMARPE